MQFFANARKFGWRTLLITHDINNIDKQIRSYVEIESRFRNLKKVKIPYTPFPMSPVNAFVIVRRYAGLGPGTGMTHSKDLYTMDPVAASMYNTLEIFRSDSVLGEYRHQGRDPDTYVVDGRAPEPEPEEKVKVRKVSSFTHQPCSPLPEYRKLVNPCSSSSRKILKV